MRPNTKVYKHAPRAYTSVGRPRYLVLGFIISGARKAGVPLQRSRYSFPVAKICAQPRTFQCACILVCVCVCVGLHQFGGEEGRGAVAALEILISGGEDLRTAEDIPMCLHFCVCVCVFVCVCVLGFIILGARNAGVPLQCSRYSFPVAKICPQLRTFQCACILLCMCVLDFVILGARNAGPCYCSS